MGFNPRKRFIHVLRRVATAYNQELRTKNSREAANFNLNWPRRGLIQLALAADAVGGKRLLKNEDGFLSLSVL